MNSIQDNCAIIDIINKGGEVCREYKRRYYEDSGMYTVFLFSEDPKINYYTVYYLPVFAAINRVTSFLIVSHIDGVGEMVVENIKVPYKFVQCTSEEAHLIGRYCTEPDDRKRIREHIIINGSDDPEEYRYRSILGVNGITKSDIAAMCILNLGHIPDDSEVEKAASVKKDHIKHRLIDWDEKDRFIPLIDPEKQEFPDVIYDELDRLIKCGSISKADEIIVFSETKTSRYIIDHLKGYKITAILDNDLSKRGMEIEGIKVTDPDSFFKENREKNCKIIVPTRSYIPICEQLYYYGYEIGKNVFVTYRRNIESTDDVDEWYEGLPKGKEIYDHIRAKHPDDWIYLCTYEGTGDIFLIGMYLRDRMKYDDVPGCVVVVASNAGKRLLETFDLQDVIREIVVLDGRPECNRLLYYVRSVGYDATNAAVLNNDYGIVLLKYISGVHGIDFNTLFQKSVFLADEKRTFVDLKKNSAEDIFENEGLSEGRTIMLSPYARTTFGFSNGVWEKIAGILLEQGYDVCTNVSGEKEEPVKGTKGVFVPYAKLIDFLDRAGGFIGLRSGLCDIVSCSSAKKVILYPEKSTYQYTSYYNYFSLEKMFDIKDNLLEIVAGEDEDVSERIVSFFGKREMV